MHPDLMAQMATIQYQDRVAAAMDQAGYRTAKAAVPSRSVALRHGPLHRRLVAVVAMMISPL